MVVKGSTLYNKDRFSKLFKKYIRKRISLGHVYEIAQKITDNRSKEFAKRVIYNEKPEFLPEQEVKNRDKIIAEKVLSMDKCSWNTIPGAMSEIDDLRESEDEIDMLDLAFGLTTTSRLGCQIEMSERLDGLRVAIPEDM